MILNRLPIISAFINWLRLINTEKNISYYFVDLNEFDKAFLFLTIPNKTPYRFVFGYHVCFTIFLILFFIISVEGILEVLLKRIAT